jgi:HSP20 family protein
MATITRWDPFQDMLTLREAMSQLFEESVVSPTGARSSGQSFVPALDLSETPEAFLVEAAVPGLKPEDLNITVENNILTISGEVRQDEERKERNYHRVERRFGSFQRIMTLPNTVKADQISATLENGVLHLSIPKTEEVKPRRISVGVTQNGQKAIEANKA